MVIWSAPAKKSLKNIYYFIAEDSKYYAKEVTEKIVARTEYLEVFPEMGRIVPEVNDDNVRELIIYSYRIIYEVVNNDIHILTIIHGKQDFPTDVKS